MRVMKCGRPVSIDRTWISDALLASNGLCDNPGEVGSVTRKEDVIYGRKFDLALTFDVFTPAKPNGVGIIHLANGGWHKAHSDPSMFAELLKRGYTVFRVVLSSEPKFTIPEEAADVHRAVRFIRYHAKEYGIDPNRLGITGASSGGHMSMLQANAGDRGNPQSSDPVEQTSSRIQAVACFFPLTDLLNYGYRDRCNAAIWVH